MLSSRVCFFICCMTCLGALVVSVVTISWVSHAVNKYDESTAAFWMELRSSAKAATCYKMNCNLELIKLLEVDVHTKALHDTAYHICSDCVHSKGWKQWFGGSFFCNTENGGPRLYGMLWAFYEYRSIVVIGCVVVLLMVVVWKMGAWVYQIIQNEVVSIQQIQMCKNETSELNREYEYHDAIEYTQPSSAFVDSVFNRSLLKSKSHKTA